MHFSGTRTHIGNLDSAYQQPSDFLEKIQTEVALGRVAGPFRKLHISNLRISPVGIVPKDNNTGWGLITYLSFPPDNSVNSFIDPSEYTVNYTSFDTVIQMLAELGKEAYIGKMDIKSAFRLLHIKICL